MRHLMPIVEWLPKYQASWIRSDILAGASVWAVLVPLALAYSGLAGVDPVIGLLTLPLALLAYAVFGGLRLMVVGPDAAVAVLSGAAIASIMVNGNEENLALSLTIALALMTGVIYLLFFVFKFGWIADLIPDPVIKGFIEGVVWVTIVKQVPSLLGLEIAGDCRGFFDTLAKIIQSVPSPHIATATLGISCVIILFVLKRFAPRLPGPLIVLVGSIICVSFFNLSETGVEVLGETNGGWSGFNIPSGLNIQTLIHLIPVALTIVVLGYTKSVGALKRAAEVGGQKFDPDHELLAIGAANIGAGLLGGYAVAGSLTATAVNTDVKGKTQMGNVFAGCLAIVTIIFLMPFLANLAFSALSAIVIVALSGLSKPSYFRKLWSVRRFEVFTGLATLLGVLALDIMPGILIGVVVSLFKLAHQIHEPATTAVARTPAGAFVDLDSHPEAKEIPGMLIWRQYAPLTFLNARILTNRLRERALEGDDIRVVVLDATASSGIDTTALSAFATTRDELAAKGIELWLVNVRDVSLKMIATSMEAADAPMPPVFESLREAVAEHEKDGKSD